MDEDLGLMPGYCQSFEGTENHTSYTVTLFDDAVWSDGAPITAQQVADWYNYITKPTADPPTRDRKMRKVRSKGLIRYSMAMRKQLRVSL